MNGFNISNMILGFALAKDLEDRAEQVRIGLVTSQLSQSPLLGVVGLKDVVDKRIQTEVEKKQVQAELAIAQRPIEIEVPKAFPRSKYSVTLRVPDATNVSVPGQTVKRFIDVAADGQKGVKLTLPDTIGDDSFSLNIDGLQREVRVKLV